MLLREISNIEKVQILSEKKEADGNVMNVRVNWAEAERLTENKRKYGKPLLQREIARLQKFVEKKSLIGTGDHPLSGLANIETASHLITSLNMDEQGFAWADLKILPTDRGKTIMTLIKSGVTIGVSSRGMGSVDEKTGEVQDDYKLLGIDIVANPSYEGGDLSQANILESLNLQEEKSLPSEDYIQEILKASFSGYEQMIGYNGTFKDWLAEGHEASIRATILVDRGIYENIETALVSMNEEDVLRKMKSEEEVHVYSDSEVYLEAKIAGISPQEMAKRLNEQEELKKVDRDSNLSVDVAKNIIQEAQNAGVNLDDPTKRAEYLKKVSENLTPGELTTHQKALEWQAKGLTEGKNYDIATLEKILRAEQKDEEAKKKRDSFLAKWEADIEMSGKQMTNEEYRVFMNRRLKAAGYDLLEET